MATPSHIRKYGHENVLFAVLATLAVLFLGISKLARMWWVRIAMGTPLLGRLQDMASPHAAAAARVALARCCPTAARRRAAIKLRISKHETIRSVSRHTGLG